MVQHLQGMVQHLVLLCCYIDVRFYHAKVSNDDHIFAVILHTCPIPECSINSASRHSKLLPHVLIIECPINVQQVRELQPKTMA